LHPPYIALRKCFESSAAIVGFACAPRKTGKALMRQRQIKFS
jgi:hypothetical protein